MDNIGSMLENKDEIKCVKKVEINFTEEITKSEEKNNNNSDASYLQENKESNRKDKEYLKVKMEIAEKRMLIDLLDDTCYNNDMKETPKNDKTCSSKCGGDSYHENGENIVEKQKVFDEVSKPERNEIKKLPLNANPSSKSENSKSVVSQKKEKIENESKTKSLETRKVTSKSKKDEKKLNAGDQERKFETKLNKNTKEIVLENEHLEGDIAMTKFVDDKKKIFVDAKKSICMDDRNKIVVDEDDDDDADVKYASSSTSSSSSSVEDDEHNDQESINEYGKGGYHCVRIGSFYNDHYKIVRKVGWGYFSTVWLSWDCRNMKYVALKIVKSGWEFADAAKDEIKLLKSVSSAHSSDKGKNRVIQMFDSFKVNGLYGKHYCLVMEVMGPNLLRLLVQSKQRGLPLVNVKIILYQIFEGLKYLHEKCKIIHTDLKPENILVVPQQKFISFSAAQLLENINEPANISANMISSQQYDAIRETVGRRRKTEKKNQDYSGNKNDLTSKSVFRLEDLAKMSICEKLKHVSRILNAKDSCKENDLLYQGKDPCKEDCAIPIKIADLGNSCWTHHQFTSDIQTLQYRCVETILRAPYGTASDMWSAACIAFELATGDFLFDPHASKEFTRSQNHLACFAEILGDIPASFAKTGKLYPKFFNKKDEMRCKPEQKITLKELLIRKYKWSKKEAINFASFLEPMLYYEPLQRNSADAMLKHPWMDGLSIQYSSDNTIKSYVFKKPQIDE